MPKYIQQVFGAYLPRSLKWVVDRPEYMQFACILDMSNETLDCGIDVSNISVRHDGLVYTELALNEARSITANEHPTLKCAVDPDTDKFDDVTYIFFI